MRHLLTLVSLLLVGSVWADDFNFNSPRAKAAMEKYQYDKKDLLRDLETAIANEQSTLFFVTKLKESRENSAAQKKSAEDNNSKSKPQNKASSDQRDAPASKSKKTSSAFAKKDASQSDLDWFENHFFKQGKFWRSNLSKKLDEKLTKAEATRNKLINNRSDYSKAKSKKQKVKDLEKAVKKNTPGKNAKKKVGNKFKKPKRQLEKGKKQEVSAGKEQRKKLKNQLKTLKKLADDIETLRADARTLRVLESYNYELSKEDWSTEIEVIQHVLKNKVSK